MMYMLSAGKAEIKRLNMAMDETAKVVQELKTELLRRKTLSDRHLSCSKTEVIENPNKINFLASNLTGTDEAQCGSSNLTEELQAEMVEMDELEAEFECELQKLPWCTKEAASGIEGRISETCKAEVSAKEIGKPDVPNLNSYEFNGVLPAELDQKLSHLLIEQQETQIVELESELQRSNSKLHEKEAQLQALKECIRRLTEFSLGTTLDGESETAQAEEEMGAGSMKLLFGMKRANGF